MCDVRSLRALTVGVVFLGCLNVSPWRADANPAPQNKGDTVRGRVLNSVTHAPVGRALVYSPDERLAALTDSTGHFEFKVSSGATQQGGEGPITTAASSAAEPNPPIFLSARKPGFLPEGDVSFTAVTPGQNEATIYLVPVASVVGRVTVAGFDFPERVRVEIYRREIQDGHARWRSAGWFRTWSNGEFSFSDLYPGTYKLFTHEVMDRDPLTYDPRGPLYGYSPVYFSGANSFQAGSTIQLSEGVTFNADLSPERREYYPVDIAITNPPEGQPLRVTVDRGGQEGPGYSLGYNARTRKIEGTLPDGAYTLEVSTSGSPGLTGTAAINIQGAPFTGYAVTMLPNPSVRLNATEEFTSAENTEVSESSGGRASFVRVSLEPADEFEVQRGRPRGLVLLPQSDETESQPRLIEDVAPGSYWVNASQVYGGYVASIKCGETDLLRNPLVVSAAGLHDPVELTLRDDGAQIDGAVENLPRSSGSSAIQSAQPPAYIYLIPTQESTGQYRDAWASPDGTFSITQIHPGRYQVLSFDRPQPELDYRNDAAMRKYEHWEQEIQLLPRQFVHLQLRLISRGD
jgi:hypothetical protein